MGTITGIHIEHAAGDGRTWPDDRTAMGLDAIDGVIFAAGIGAPDHMAVPGGIGAQGPIGGAGEHHAFDYARRGGLRRRAAWSWRTGRGRRGCKPGTLSGCEIDGMQAAGMW